MHIFLRLLLTIALFADVVHSQGARGGSGGSRGGGSRFGGGYRGNNIISPTKFVVNSTAPF